MLEPVQDVTSFIFLCDLFELLTVSFSSGHLYFEFSREVVIFVIYISLVDLHKKKKNTTKVVETNSKLQTALKVRLLSLFIQ